MTDKPIGGPYLTDAAREALKAGMGAFGVCPECGSAGLYCNVYKTHFAYCGDHGFVWSPGSNLMSSWRHESEDDWRASWERIRDYRTVDGFGEYGPGAPLAEQTSFEDLMPEVGSGE